MTRRLAPGLALLLAGAALAQEGPAGVELEVRTGMSLTDRGAAVDGAFAAYVEPGEGPLEAASRARTTDAEGRLRLDVPAAGGVLLVWKPGHAPAALHVERPGARRLDLLPGRNLRGVVVTQQGEPVPDAAVRVEVELPLTSSTGSGPGSQVYHASAEADAAGEFEVPDLPRHPVSVEAHAEGWVSARVFPATPGAAPLRLVLGRGATVAGTLTLRPPGPIPAGTRVAVGPRDAPVAEDGTFRLAAVPPGAQPVHLEARGLQLAAPRTLVLEEGDERRDVALEAWRAAALEVLLGDAQGDPIPAAVLELTWPPGAGARPERFEVAPAPGEPVRIEGLHPADGVALRIEAEGFVPLLVPAGLALRPGEVTRAEYRLDPGGRLAGRVLDAAGTPVAAATVRAAWQPSGRAEERSAAAATGSDGSFELSGVAPGDVAVLVEPPPGAAATAGRFGPFRVARGETADAGALRLGTGHDLQGRVLGAEAGTAVRALRGRRVLAKTQVDESGRFELRGLSAGRTRIVAVGDDGEVGASQTLDVPAPWFLELVWVPRVELSGRLVDPSGDPVPVAELRVEPLSEDGSSAAIESAVRDAEGTFAVRVPTGWYELSAASAAGLVGNLRVNVPAAGSTDVRLVLRGGETLRGVVVSAEGQLPVEGALVRALRPDGDGGRAGMPARVDSQGSFALRGVPHGVVRVRIEAPGYIARELGPLVVREAEAPYIGRIELRRGLRVRGVVTEAAEVPAAGAPLAFESLVTGDVRTATTDVYGRYEIDGVPPGPVLVRVGADEAAVLRRFVPWGRDEVRLDLELGRGTRLVGTVSTAGRPEPFAHVTAWSLAADRRLVEGRADEHGRFALPPLPAGPTAVEVTPAGSDVPWRTDLALPDAGDHFVDLRLPEAWLAGTVRAEDGGEALSGVRLSLVERGPPHRVLGRAVSGPGGAFRIARVPSGVPADLVAERRGYGEVVLQDLVLAPGEGRSGLALTLPRPAAVTVLLLDRRARPIPGGWLAAEREGGGLRRVALAAADGRATIEDLAPGAWDLSAGAPGLGRRALGTVRLRTLDRHDLGSVFLEPASALEVHVVGPRFVPLPGVRVEVRDAEGRDPRPPLAAEAPLRGPDPRHFTGPDGRVVVPGLPPGTYEVRVPGTSSVARVRLGEQEVRTVLLAGWTLGER